MKFLSLIVIVCACLVVGGQASSAKKEAVDFDRLNVYLEMFEDKDENLFSLVEENVDRLASGVQRAARILIKLSKFSGGRCNDNLMSSLKEASSAGLKLARGLASRHSRRIDKLIRPGLTKALRACQRLVATQIQETVAKDSVMDRFVQVVGLKEDSGQLEQTAAPSLDDVRNYLWQLSHNDPDAKYTDHAAGRPIVYLEALENAFEEYLVSPCEKWASKLEELFLSAYSLANIQTGRSSFTGYRFERFRRLAWTNEVCQLVLDMDDDDKSQMVTNGDRVFQVIRQTSSI